MVEGMGEQFLNTLNYKLQFAVINHFLRKRKKRKQKKQIVEATTISMFSFSFFLHVFLCLEHV